MLVLTVALALAFALALVLVLVLEVPGGGFECVLGVVVVRVLVGVTGVLDVAG